MRKEKHVLNLVTHFFDMGFSDESIAENLQSQSAWRDWNINARIVGAMRDLYEQNCRLRKYEKSWKQIQAATAARKDASTDGPKRGRPFSPDTVVNELGASDTRREIEKPETNARVG